MYNNSSVYEPRFSLRGSGGNYLRWNGSALEMNGSITISGGSGIQNLSDAGAMASIDQINSGNSTTYIGAGTIVTNQVATNLITSTNYSYTSGNFSNAGTYIDLAGSTIRSKNFAVDSSGDAYVRGTITANAGNFNGYMTVAGGTMKFGKDAGGSGVHGIYMDANNFWYSGDSSTYAGNFKVGDGSSYMHWNGSSLSVTGQINATSGVFTGYVSAGNMRIGTDVNSTNDGIYFTSNNDYIYDSGIFRLGNGNLVWNGSTLTITGNGTFTGDLTGASGTFGGATINGSGVTFGNFRLLSTGISFVSYNFNSEVQDYSMFTQRLRLYQNNTSQGSHTDSLQFDYLEPVSSGTVSMQVTPGGLVKKASSSRRYKKNIEDTTLDDANRILNLNVRSFNGLSQKDGDPKVVGLVAEEVLDLGYDDLVIMSESGSIESVYYQSVFSSMLKVVQNLNKRVEDLEAIISGSK